MAESQDKSHRRQVELSPRADVDRFEIYVYTESNLGETQAEEYRVLLSSTMQLLADTPKIAAFVPGRKNVRLFVVQGPTLITDIEFSFAEPRTE